MAVDILFVSHNASRSGAPLILLNLIRELKSRGGYNIFILIVERGDLVQEFEKLGKTFVLYESISFVDKGMFTRTFQRLKYYIRGNHILSQLPKQGIVFLNTIANGHLHRKLVSPERSFFTYVHEMEYSIRAVTDSSSLSTVLKQSDHFFSGSLAVAHELQQKFGVSGDKISNVYSCLEIDGPEYRDQGRSSTLFKKNHGLKEGAFIVGCAGNSEWRKGFDFFHALVPLYLYMYPDSNAVFVWKGYSAIGRNTFYEQYDYQKTEFLNRVVLLEHDKKSLETISAFDVLVLPSREDPFPLVVLEAAAFGIPTVCFRNAGGIPEFVLGDAGISVEYGDLFNMAQGIRKLEQDPVLRASMGNVARQRTAGKHTPSYALDRILEGINTSLEKKIVQ